MLLFRSLPTSDFEGMVIYKALVIASFVVAIHGQAPGQAADFNVDPATAVSYTCNATCQDVLAFTIQADLATIGTDFDFDFYNTADNFAYSVPGDLLKLQAINTSSISGLLPGMSSYRFQYTSRDLDGNSVPSTGFIAIPFTRPVYDGKFPLIAFAHGTIGLYRGCTPSSAPQLFDYDTWTPLLLRGYAVVATDYAGLGNNFTEHKYISFAAHAHDIYYSVQAARKAFPTAFTEEWMSMGHSQGGGAVWKLSEYPLVQSPSSGYLGTVSFAPATKVYDMAVLAARDILPLPNFHDYVIAGEVASLAVAVQRVFPQYTPAWLGDDMKKRIQLSDIGQFCSDAFLGLSLDLSLEELVVPSVDVASDTVLQQFQRLNAPAQGDCASQPMLVIQGLNDTSILPEITAAAFKDATTFGNEIHMVWYPGLDHSATVAAASPEWLKFIDDRFAKRKLDGLSTNRTVKPFDLVNAYAPLDLPLPLPLGL